MPLRRLFLLGAAALACVAALLAIVSLLSGDFGDTEGKLFATIGAAFVAISAVAAGAALLERGVARPLGFAGLVLAAAGFLLWTEQVWAEHESERYWRVLWFVLTWTLAFLLATTTRLTTRTERLENAEKVRQQRSRIVQTLNVPLRVRLRAFTRCGLAERPF